MRLEQRHRGDAVRWKTADRPWGQTTALGLRPWARTCWHCEHRFIFESHWQGAVSGYGGSKVVSRLKFACSTCAQDMDSADALFKATRPQNESVVEAMEARGNPLPPVFTKSPLKEDAA